MLNQIDKAEIFDPLAMIEDGCEVWCAYLDEEDIDIRFDIEDRTITTANAKSKKK